MAARPYWSGQIRISLVSFAITLTSALKRASQIPLHEFKRKTGARIHHQNVTEDGEVVERDDIIKGYDLGDEEYVFLEPEEIDDIKLPSSDTFELTQFIDIAAIPSYRYERPYFVLPDGKDAKEIYAVIHDALLKAGKAGLGQIAMRGREELCALLPVENGLMLQTLRYDSELQDVDDFLAAAPAKKLKGDYVTLAKQLIDKNSHAPSFAKFHDHYHEALQELINAKKAHRKPRYAKAEKASSKVVNFMDALKKSLKDGGAKTGSKAASKSKTKSRRKAA